jgi:hypothetical protein
VSLPASLLKCLWCMKKMYIIRKKVNLFIICNLLITRCLTLYLTTINLWMQYDSDTVHTVLFYKNDMVCSFVKLWQYLLIFFHLLYDDIDELCQWFVVLLSLEDIIY